jgi:1-acyl-sn-glycerol-3-phosphate acyltransferase
MSKIYSVLYIPILIIISLFSIFGAYIVYLITRDSKKANIVARFWGKLLVLTSFTKVEIIKEDFNLNSKYVIMTNHQSAFDIFILYGYLPLDFTFLSKIEIFKIPLFGIAMKIVGAIGVERGNTAKLKSTISAMQNYMNKNRSLLIFPEGTRSYDGKLLPFKKGGFMLAKKSNAEILPVALIGSCNVLKKGSFFINPFRKVKLIISKPIETKNKNLNSLMNEVRSVLENNLKKQS